MAHPAIEHDRSLAPGLYRVDAGFELGDHAAADRTVFPQTGNVRVFDHSIVTDRKQVDSAVAETSSRLGGVDILVANAGTNIRKKPQDYTAEEWHQVVDTNLTSMFICCQAAYPEMVKRGGGKVVTIGSMLPMVLRV